MAYSSPDDVRKVYPKVFTVGLTPEELDLGPRALADALIDGKLAQRYAVPFASGASTPPLIKMLSLMLTVAFAYDRAANTPDWVTRLAQRADDMLKDLASGALGVIDTGGNLIPARPDTNMPASSVSGYVPTFGVVPSMSETADPNRSDDEEAARR